MNRTADCLALLKKSNLSVEIPGFTAKEAAEAFCTTCRYDKSFNGMITEGLIQRARSSKWPTLDKAVLGGIQHVISVDNAAGYAELWYKGGSWYAVTGANLAKAMGIDGGFYEVKGITKGMSVTEAAPRFLEAFFPPLVKADIPCPCNK